MMDKKQKTLKIVIKPEIKKTASEVLNNPNYSANAKKLAGFIMREIPEREKPKPKKKP